jgi:hypothetical protein
MRLTLKAQKLNAMVSAVPVDPPKLINLRALDDITAPSSRP